MKTTATLTNIVIALALTVLPATSGDLENSFKSPPDSARPGVYWYFMDGNLDQKEMIKDLDSMKEAGLGNVIHLEVNVNVPRGPVESLSPQWFEMFANTIHHAEKIGIDVTLGTGPGWTGSGGPWIKQEESMQHLVYSETNAKGPSSFDAKLPVAPQRDHWWKMLDCEFYQDVAVYAFPACDPVIEKSDEKAFYKRPSYSSGETSGFFSAPAKHAAVPAQNVIDPTKIIDLTKYLQEDGTLKWKVPAGDWTIMRFGRRSNGTSNRPASLPVVGLDHDKFDKKLLEKHFDHYTGKLIEKVGTRAPGLKGGLKAIHLDSWEMNAQNWSPAFPDEFRKRRGYDLSPYLPAFSGRVVKDLATTERVLWDMRLTVQELILENYAGHLRTLAHQRGMEFSIEPYGMTQTADLELGVYADVPMCEFWSTKYDTSDSCIAAASIAHVLGRPIVGSEAFTGHRDERGQHYPGSLKNQGDWAFAMGVNRFAYHTFTHKPLGEKGLPGMTMGEWGIRWDRGQTWWPMVGDYHRYVTRCSHVLRQGLTVSDVLYLTPEGAPHVFEPPHSALVARGTLLDKKGHSFDGCPPGLLEKMVVRDGRVGVMGGSQYRLLVMPRFDTATPAFLKQVMRLVADGATVIGYPPSASPSMSDYPACDLEVKRLAEKLWGKPPYVAERKYGKGRIILDAGAGKFIASNPEPTTRKNKLSIYPSYGFTSGIFEEMGVVEDFKSDVPLRFTHRRSEAADIYFVSNPVDQPVKASATFRVTNATPQLWDAITGNVRALPQFKQSEKTTTVPLTFAPYQSYFVVFPRDPRDQKMASDGVNFPKSKPVATIDGSWEVAFDPKWGGPAKVMFDKLQDWTQHSERGIKYYSGIATYHKSFDAPDISGKPGKRTYLDLGTVHDMARVTLNGKNLGVVWCAPWQVDITDALKPKDNKLEIEIANRWSNRQLGDQQAPDKHVRTLKWESGLLGGKEFKAGRYTFSTGRDLGKLLPSGLIGPVRIMSENN